MMCRISTRRRVLSTALVLASVSAASQAADLIPYGSTWSYLNPVTTAENPGTVDANFDANWFKPNFNLNSPIKWSGPSAEPFVRGTADNPAIEAFTSTDTDFVRAPGTYLTLPETRNRYTSYFRHTFTTTSPTNGLALEFLADDGARFYLDGQEILSENCCLTAATNGTNVPPGTIAKFTDVATALGNERTYTLRPVLVGGSLPAGTHTLAVSVHQQGAGTSNDMGFSARLIDGYAYSMPVPMGAEYKFVVPVEEPSADPLGWTKVGFNDSSWNAGKEPFGYENTVDPPNNIERISAGTDLSAFDMIGTHSSVYLRKQFTVDDVAKYKEIQITADWDDGFIAYINGTEVLRRNVAGTAGTPAAFDSFATDHESSNAGTPTIFPIQISDFPNLLKNGGQNVLSFHGLNVNLTSSDFYLGQLSLALAGAAPTSSKPGDYDGNGTLDAGDINALSAAVRAGSTDLKFDANGDRAVNESDRLTWVNTLKNTWMGDSNLDGQFNTADFVFVFQSGQFEDGIAGNSSWETGDWNGDREFATSDFILAFQEGGFEAGGRPGGVNAVSAVPEPTSAVLFGLSSLGLLGLARKRR